MQKMASLPEFECRDCGNNCAVWLGRVPQPLLMTDSQFESMWNLHPQAHAEIRMHGRKVPIPRWQQAYGVDYHFSGEVNRALPIPKLLAPLLAWCRETIDDRLNGLLRNWYDGHLGHYIGRHRDSVTNMAVGAPIVTISFGEERTFRLRPWKAEKTAPAIDFQVTAGSVIVMPYETNRVFTHEVPASKKLLGRRISVTARAFVQ